MKAPNKPIKKNNPLEEAANMLEFFDHRLRKELDSREKSSPSHANDRSSGQETQS